MRQTDIEVPCVCPACGADLRTAGCVIGGSLAAWAVQVGDGTCRLAADEELAPDFVATCGECGYILHGSGTDRD